MIKANAYISPRQRKQALHAAGYHARVPKIPGNARCSNCRYHDPAQIHFTATRYDLHCKVFGIGVKTHGACNNHAPAAKAGAK